MRPSKLGIHAHVVGAVVAQSRVLEPDWQGECMEVEEDQYGVLVPKQSEKGAPWRGN